MIETVLLLTVIIVLFLYTFRSSGMKANAIKPLPVQCLVGDTRLPGESPIYRHPLTPHSQPLMLHTKHLPGVTTVYDAFLHGLSKSANAPCFGVRLNDGPYVYDTYQEVNDRILAFGSGLLECGLKSRDSQAFVGILGKNSPEWVITELACAAYSLILVPLYDTLGPDAIKYIINQTQLSVVVVEQDKLANVLAVASACPSLKYVVKIGSLTPEDKRLAKDAKISLLYFKGLESLGKDGMKPVVPAKPDDLLTICYTSGTTGDPKGVMITHKNVVAEIAAVLSTFPDGVELTSNEVHLSFLPLAHIFEMLMMAALLGLGARVAFFRGDVLKLLDDVVAAKPTIFPAVPRLLNRVYSKVLATVNEGSAVKKWLFHTGLQSKKNLLKQGIVTRNTFWDRLVFGKVQARLGGNVRAIITGAAPISAEVLDFLRAAFGCEVLEGYGQTETAAAALFTSFGDYSTLGHVGTVIPSCEIKLKDIPEMSYLSTDVPNPRGEILVRGNNVFQGYYKMPEKTAETLDKNGWCYTGDVGELLSNGTFKIIDRKKNIFKLSQGEYIAAEKIENVYIKAPLVAQVFVYGDSLKSCLVAIVVLDPDQLTKLSLAGKSDAELNSNADLKKRVLDGMLAAGKERKLHSFEQVKDIYLTLEAFTPENNLLTPSFKHKRHELKLKYKPQIDKMYAKLD